MRFCFCVLSNFAIFGGRKKFTLFIFQNLTINFEAKRNFKKSLDYHCTNVSQFVLLNDSKKILFFSHRDFAMQASKVEFLFFILNRDFFYIFLSLSLSLSPSPLYFSPPSFFPLSLSPYIYLSHSLFRNAHNTWMVFFF